MPQLQAKGKGQRQVGGLKLKEALELVAAGDTSSGYSHEMANLQSEALNLD